MTTFPHSTFITAIFSELLNWIFSRSIFLTKKHLFLVIKKKLNENIPNEIKNINKIFSESDAFTFFIIYLKIFNFINSSFNKLYLVK